MHSCQRENSLNRMLDDDDLRVVMIMNLMMILKSFQRVGETKPAVSANGNDNGQRWNKITKIPSLKIFILICSIYYYI